MTDFVIRDNVHIIADSTSGAKAFQAEWFSEDITIILSSNSKAARLILDFAFPESSVVEITRDGGTIWIPLNENTAMIGEQSRLIPVNNGDIINFRATDAGGVTLSYASFGEV